MEDSQQASDQCEFCNRQVVWVRTLVGGWIAVEPGERVVRGEKFDPRRHVAHMIVCPNRPLEKR
jgi:hypothetical protein